VLNIGQVVLNCRIMRSLGAGELWDTYEAENLKISRHFVLIQLAEGFPHDDRVMYERLVVISRLRHPNICTTYGVRTHEGRVFLVTELLRGNGLNSELAGKPLDLGIVLIGAIDIASAL
jgi:hypothetical protein